MANLEAKWLQRFPWLPKVLPWITVGILGVDFGVNIATDNLGLAAINCFFLGFLFGALLVLRQSAIRRTALHAMIARCDEAHQAMERARAELERAITEGRVEVVPLQPGDEPPFGKTFH